MRLEVTTTNRHSIGILRHRSKGVRHTLLLVALLLALLAAPVLPGPRTGPVASASAAPPFTLYMPVPWGVTVTVNGPHGWLGSSGTRGGVDFFPKGGLTVTSAASGVAHVESNCLVRVDHADGWQTKYLHLKNIDRSINGQQVDAGRRLGDAGSPAETCGTGWGAHVHFALFRNGVEQSIDGTSIGGYTVHNGGGYYCGWWSRDSDGANLGYNNCDTGEATLALPNNQRQPGPPDTDGDGIPNASDRCPDQGGPANTQGCPDRDGDAVADLDDKCSEPGEAAEQGCQAEVGYAIDVNGDKRADLIHRWSTGVNTWLSKGDGSYDIKGQQAQAGYGYNDGVWPSSSASLGLLEPAPQVPPSGNPGDPGGSPGPNPGNGAGALPSNQPAGLVTGVRKKRVNSRWVRVLWKPATGADHYRARISSPKKKRTKWVTVRVAHVRVSLRRGQHAVFALQAVGPGGAGPVTRWRL